MRNLGIINRHIYRNLKVPEYYEMGVRKEPANPITRPTTIASSGALCAYSAKATGRSPKDKRIVEEDFSKNDIWWGKVNMPLPESSWLINKQRAIDYLNNRPYLYVVDGYAGWDTRYRMKIRVITTRAYHALFMHNMLIRPTNEELVNDFDNIDFHILNAGEFPADKNTLGVGTQTSINVNLKDRMMVILGTQYAGEMKKGVFGVMQYFMPKLGAVSLHASANEGAKGDTTLLFGLSGTGKTTLSADPKRRLIGDDEHCWSDSGIFNIEGGCYAKCINLSVETEPEIYNAIRFGSILENVQFFPGTREVNYADVSLTENTRCSYPLEYIPNVKIPAIGGHPKNVIFLTCDAYGVLPPVSKLTPEQTMYHFMTGYTAKVAGTEIGVTEPQPTFSSCFGEAFLSLHPSVYAKMLAEKLVKHQANCWLINTGWSGGKFGVGKRMSLKITRRIIDEIHAGNLDKAPLRTLPVFGLQVPETVEGVPPEIVWPKDSWKDKEDYDNTLVKLAKAFVQNFKKYEAETSPEIKAAGPKID
jgi:phosphoenolpyruvate carboxykinase (ATP)